MTLKVCVLAMCLITVPFLVDAQDKPETPKPSEPSPSRSIFQDPGFVGAIVGAFLGAFATLGATQLGVFLSAKTGQNESRRQIVRELQKEFVYGSMLPARLRAELLLFHDVHQQFKGKNFEELYKGAMPLEQYADVAAVLNLFRLLSDYKEADHIDEAEARAAFGWIYRWWWTNVIEPYSKGLQNNPDWAPHVTRRDWLLK